MHDSRNDALTSPDTKWVWPGTVWIPEIVWDGAATLSSPTHIMYNKNGDDVSATFLAGSTTLSGRTQTGKTTSALTAGETYTMYFGVTRGSETPIKATRVICGEYGKGF